MIKRWMKKKIRQSEKLADKIRRVTSGVDAIYQYANTSVLDQRVIRLLCPDGRIRVMGGAFQGLKYPDMEATGSSLGLKITGIYEEELEGVLQKILETPYEEVWDIGAAEGYYAVGIACSKPEITVYAYDIDPYARELLKKMSQINHVSDRVEIKSLCSKETILNSDFRKKTLLIMDCEGYERNLLTEDTREALKNVDILVEIHDNLGKGETVIGDQVRQAFQYTHHIEVIESISTAEKAERHKGEDWCKGFTSQERLDFMHERIWDMAWFYMVSKCNGK